MPKPSAIDASTLLATKGPTVPAPATGSLQRGQTGSEALVDLNFKVPRAFRDRFKRLAFEAGLKNVQLLVRAVEALEREAQRPHPNGRAS